MYLAPIKSQIIQSSLQQMSFSNDILDYIGAL